MKDYRVIIPQTEDEKKLWKRLFLGQQLFYENKLGEFKSVTVCDVKRKFFFVRDENNKVVRCSVDGGKLKGADFKARKILQIHHYSNVLFFSVDDLKQDRANMEIKKNSENLLDSISRKLCGLDGLLDADKIKAVYDFVHKL